MTESSPSDEMNRTRVFTAGAWDAVPVLPPHQERQHFLVAVPGQGGQRLSLGAQPLRLGRSADCGFVVPDEQVSGKHCEISVPAHAQHALVTDLGSTNGTYIDGVRIHGSARLSNGGLLQIGKQVFRHEWLLKSDVDKAEELERELQKARHYVQSLLPEPIRTGPVLTDWVFEPSMQLGGDAFGYHQLGADLFACYLVDVAGHGVGAAMHSVSVMNVLRQRALPGTDFAQPAQVLHSLNAMFGMDAHDGICLTAWYGVYDMSTRVLRYASAGHHPAYLVAPQASVPMPLKTRNLVIGAVPEARFTDAQAVVPPGSRLYVFSDGVFEVATAQGTQWALDDFLALLTQPEIAGVSQSTRLYGQVREVARAGPLDDDFSLLVVTLL